MGSLVQFPQTEPPQRVVPLDFDARLHHAIQQRARHFAAADPIEHPMHLDACRGASNQRVGELLANAAGPIKRSYRLQRKGM
jgi:hypothetical protein